MSSSSSPSHDHEPKTNEVVYHRSLQNSRYPSFHFLDYSNPIQNELKNPSSTTNDAAKQQNKTKKKIIWFFSYSVTSNHKDDEKQNKHTYSCDVCNKVFTSNKALNGHKICHTQEGVIHPQTASPSSFEQKHIDCSKYLPPISFKTKKRQRRRRRYMNIDDDVIAAETLLHISCGGYEGSSANIDVNHRGAKSQKLSCNMMNDDEKKKKKEQGVLLTSGDIDETLKDDSHNEKKLVLRFKIPKGKIFQTSQDCKELPSSNHGIEEKKINEGVTELGSKVVKNFDLNELPSDDFEDETN